jgi:hypothetical protein
MSFALPDVVLRPAMVAGTGSVVGSIRETSDHLGTWVAVSYLSAGNVQLHAQNPPLGHAASSNMMSDM